MNHYIPSPCIRHCTLNPDDLCMGCYRTRGEILNWTRMPPEQQAATLKQCDIRREMNQKSILSKLKRLI
jgi:hypothetical protein